MDPSIFRDGRMARMKGSRMPMHDYDLVHDTSDMCHVIM